MISEVGINRAIHVEYLYIILQNVDSRKAKQSGEICMYEMKLRQSIAQLEQALVEKDYDRWWYCYPAYDDTHIRATVPPDIPVCAKRGRKRKAR